MNAWLAVWWLGVAPPDAGAGPQGGPSARSLAQLYFEAADLAKSVNAAQACIRLEGPRCRPLLVAIVEYQALAGHLDSLSKADATAMIAYDRQINPTRELAKMTRRVHQRFVVDPFERAQVAVQADQADAAKNLLRNVLDVDPRYAPAKALLAELSAPPGKTAHDGG